MDSSSAWAHAELDSRISELAARGEWDHEARVHISNPVVRKEIAELIRTEAWPGIEKIFAPTELLVDTCSEDGRPAITEKRDAIDTTMSFIMLVQSREIPQLSGSDPFFCRMSVECSTRGFVIGSDFMLYLPEQFPFAELRRLLAHPEFCGNPPTLHCESAELEHEGCPLVVAFEHRLGYFYPDALLPVHTMLADIAERVNFLRRLIRSIHHLCQDYGDSSRFHAVVAELVKCFPCS